MLQNRGVQSLVQMLGSSSKETQEYDTSILVDVFDGRKGICGNLGRINIINTLIKLLSIGTKHIAM